MPAARAASSRLMPSRALASASRRALTRPSRSRRASARSSADVRPVAIGTATMAPAPGMLHPPGQLARRGHRSRLPTAGIMSGKNNLTVRGLESLVSDDLKKDFADQVARTLIASSFCRDWRNRHIAHRDLALLTVPGAKGRAEVS